MLALLLLIIFGLGVAYFATQNTGLVHILLGGYLMKDIPLYVIVVGSLLLGIFISWLVSMVDTFSTFFTLHGKDSEIKRIQKELQHLQHENQILEEENNRLKRTIDGEISQEEIASQESSLNPRMGHAFGFR